MQHATIICQMSEEAGCCSYNDANKAKFKKSAMHLMKKLAVLVGGQRGDVRYNAGGCAVSGEVTLHTECIYVSLNLGYDKDLGYLVRTCKGKKDYTGGRNTWFQYDTLKDLDMVAGIINKMINDQKVLNIILSNKNTASVI